MSVTRQLLRIATAGSVDDGKSTLIGRLLHDTDSLPLDHLEAVTDDRGRRRPRGAVRRPARRTRARHHHRRGLPLLFHRRPQLHPGRHARSRALHPQHVHRRVERTRGDPSGRRPRGSAAADPSARPDRKAVGHQALCGRPSTRSTLSTSTRTGSPRSNRAAATRGPPGQHRDHRHPDRGQARRQRGSPLDSTPRGTTARRCWTTWKASNWLRRRPSRPGCDCRCNGFRGRPPTSAAATPGGWRRARSASATR